MGVRRCARRTAAAALLMFASLTPSLAASVAWPLTINGRGRYLEDQNGVPFLMIGDSAWDMPAKLSPSEVTAYLDNRRARGFTTIVIRAMSPAAFGGPGNYAGAHPFLKGTADWSLRSETYWKHVDFILNQAKARGMLVMVFPAYLGWRCAEQGWCREMVAQTDAAMADFGTWLGTRYRDQGNVLWAHGGDADCAEYAGACGRVNALAEALRMAAGGGLHTARSAPERSALDDYNRKWLNVNTSYSYADPAGEVRSDYLRANTLPFTYQEGAYENEHDSTALTWQSQAFAAYLGGARLGHYFGACPLWNFDARTDWCTRTSERWRTQLDDPGSVIMGNIARLLRSRSWHTLMPDYDDTVVTSAKGSGLHYHSTAREADGRTVLVWCPNIEPVVIAMAAVAGTQAKAWWYDPDDNSAREIGTLPTAGSRTFTPPRARLVLVLDDAGQSLPVPGGTAVAAPSPRRDPPG